MLRLVLHYLTENATEDQRTEVLEILDEAHADTLAVLHAGATEIIGEGDPLLLGITPPSWWRGDAEAGEVTGKW